MPIQKRICLGDRYTADPDRSLAVSVRKTRWCSPIDGADFPVASQSCGRRVLGYFTAKAKPASSSAVVEFDCEAVDFRAEAIPPSLCDAVASEFAKPSAIQNAILNRRRVFFLSDDIGFDVESKASVIADGPTFFQWCVAAERARTQGRRRQTNADIDNRDAQKHQHAQDRLARRIDTWTIMMTVSASLDKGMGSSNSSEHIIFTEPAGIWRALILRPATSCFVSRNAVEASVSCLLNY